jgi:acetyl/propionyl-CoA carboxylase alpha subunit
VEGSEISMLYDTMISKLWTHGATRNEAIANMKNALNSYVIRGLNHNGEFLQDLYRHPRFVAGDLSESRWLYCVLFLFFCFFWSFCNRCPDLPPLF